MIAGTQVGNNMKTRRRHNRNIQNIAACVTHPKEAHLTQKTDVQSPGTNIHKLGAHQAVSTTKGGARGGTHGSAGPMSAPLGLNFGRKIVLILLKAVPSVSIFNSGGNRPHWAIKRAFLTRHNTPTSSLPPSLEDVVLQCKGKALPRLVLRVGGG